MLQKERGVGELVIKVWENFYSPANTGWVHIDDPRMKPN